MINPINLQEMIKSRKHAIFAVTSAVLIMLIYKVYKQVLDLSDEDFFLTQLAYTPYRIFSTISGLYICSRVYKEMNFLKLKKSSPTIIFFSSYLILDFLFFYLGYKSFSVDRFLFFMEVIINVFVGFSEEYMFRGLIFAGMYYIWGFRISILFSSLLFALWHIDIDTSLIYMINLFSFSVCFSLAYLYGISLTTLATIHYLHDLLIFGIDWKQPNLFGNVHFLILNIIFIIVFILQKKRFDSSSKNL